MENARIKNFIAEVNEFEKRLNRKITIVAATKTVSAETVCKLPELGITQAGENRVQEYLSKKDRVKGVQWHFIGALQKNKVKYLVGNVALIQSVDSRALADLISSEAEKRGVTQHVLLEVNISREPNKSGVDPSELSEFCEYCAALKNLKADGLMAIPKVEADASDYQRLQELYSSVKEVYGYSILSVGMSNDYKTAIEYGSNMIRPGRVLFGECAKREV